MNPSMIGERAEGAVLARLLKHDYFVLTPFGASRRYDLVIERNGDFQRVQVKHGKLDNDAVVFRTFSTSGRGQHRIAKGYEGEIEFFGVYCSETDQVFLVPASDVSVGDCRLRMSPPRNGQVKGIRWAQDYLLQ